MSVKRKILYKIIFVHNRFTSNTLLKKIKVNSYVKNYNGYYESYFSCSDCHDGYICDS